MSLLFTSGSCFFFLFFSSLSLFWWCYSFISTKQKEYFDRGNYNLFFVDWSELARAPCYPSAAHNTKHAGECIGQLINRIRDSGTENIHIIGFSLGAHVAGFAANQANDLKIPRITGLYLIYLRRLLMVSSLFYLFFLHKFIVQYE